MLISSLRMKNVRSFYGEHQLELSPTDAASLIVIHGENMRGKTSIMQAIRWGLYGEVTDRHGTVIPVYDPKAKEQLLSLVAASEGDYTMFVEVNFTHAGEEYQIRREARAEGQVESDADFKVVPTLKRGPHVLAEAGIAPAIEAILSREVSRFFLFDGEMLQDYEELLKNPDEETLLVRNSIEKILGVPALGVFEDLEDLAANDEKRLNALLKKRAKYEGLVDAANQLKNEISGMQRDRAELRFQLQERRGKLEEAEKAVAVMRDNEKLLLRKNELEQKIQESEAAIAEHEGAIRETLRAKWWLPASRAIEQRLSAIRDEIEDGMERLETNSLLRGLEGSIAAKECTQCELPLDHHDLDRVREKLTRLKLENYTFEPLSVLDAYRRQRLYEKFQASDAVAEVGLRQHEIDKARIAKGDAESQIKLLEAQMAGRARGDMKAKIERWQRLTTQVEVLENQICDLEKRLVEKTAEHDKKQRELTGLPDADPKLSLQVKTYWAFAKIFRSAMEEFREEARVAVGRDASAIFRQLTTETAYTGLQINESYGLALLDSNGDPIPGRSSGAEQIVALSLIGGLNKAAVREGPVIMDTNFGRLDLDHRENVLRFLPELGRQVIVLVHSGELPKDQELSDIGISVARRYEVVRISETRSEIRELAS